MRIVSMFTFRVFGWGGLHARACFSFFLRPVRVSATFWTALFVEPLAWWTRPCFLRSTRPDLPHATLASRINSRRGTCRLRSKHEALGFQSLRATPSGPRTPKGVSY
jgi:hypothetical protein